MVYFEVADGNGCPQMICSDRMAGMSYVPMWGGQPAVEVHDDRGQTLFHLAAANTDAATDIMRMLSNDATGKAVGTQITGSVVLEHRIERLNAKY